MFPIPPGTHWSEVRAVAAPVSVALTHQVRALPAPAARGPRGANKPARSAHAPMGGFRFQSDVAGESVKSPKAKKPKAAAVKIDPKYLKAARELRDRYLEHVNAAASLPPARGKYDVSRQLQAPTMAKQAPLLTAA